VLTRLLEEVSELVDDDDEAEFEEGPDDDSVDDVSLLLPLLVSLLLLERIKFEFVLITFKLLNFDSGILVQRCLGAERF
jgi:hypothetical protein